MAPGRYIFTSDLHLGADCPRDTEAEFIAFLDSLPGDTRALYLLGDVFDFWFEKRSRRCGYDKVLEALRRTAGRGTEVFFLKGNHDWWTLGELEQLGGLTLLQPQPVELTIAGKRFCLAHGDGLGKDSFKERLTQAILKGRVTIFLARWLTPARWLDGLARIWAGSSRRKNIAHPYTFTTDSPLWSYTCQREKEHPADFFVYGHIHSPITMDTPMGGKMYILSDWSSGPSWLEFDGEKMTRCGAGGAVGGDDARPADYKENKPQENNGRAASLHSDAGFSVPLALVRTRSSRGCGDLGGLKLLVDIACELGLGSVNALRVIDSAAGQKATAGCRTPSGTSIAGSGPGFPISPVLADIQAIEQLSPAGKQAGYLAKSSALESETEIDFSKVYNAKMHYLNEIFQQEGGKVLSSDAYHSFWRANRQWLEQYSAYCVLRHKYGTGDSRYWSEPEYERLLEDESFIKEYSADMRFHLYVQFILHRQMEDALAYAAAKGIELDFTDRQGDLPQTMRLKWAQFGAQERRAWCKDALGIDLEPPQQLEGWLAENLLIKRLKDGNDLRNIPLEDLLGITRILPCPAPDAGGGSNQAVLRMPVGLEHILEHKALLEQIRKVIDSSIG